MLLLPGGGTLPEEYTMDQHENGLQQWRWKTTSRRERWATAWGVGWRLGVVGAVLAGVVAAVLLAVTLLVSFLPAVSINGLGDTGTDGGRGFGARLFAFLQPPDASGPGRLSAVVSGDCFDTTLAAGGALDSFEQKPCTQPHSYEVSGVISTETFLAHDELANEGYCLSIAISYLGRAPNAGDGLEPDWFLIDAADPNGLICVVHSYSPIDHAVAGQLSS